jgi:hypothetical protein
MFSVSGLKKPREGLFQQPVWKSPEMGSASSKLSNASEDGKQT